MKSKSESHKAKIHLDMIDSASRPGNKLLAKVRSWIWSSWQALAPIALSFRFPALVSFGARILGLALVLTVLSNAQQPQGGLDPNAIMGFETLGTWSVSGNSSSGFVAQSTADRTQGNAALSISNPPNMMKIVSQPIASTATALTGIGNSGALLEIDVLIPVQQGNATNSGWIQPYVTSKSRGLSKVPLAQVFFNSYREGIYNTIGFPIPGSVASALNDATYSDLVFEFDISSPGRITGTYLLDNLRVHSVPLIQSPTGQAPPPGYGGSVNLDVFGSAPTTQTYDLSPTQIPDDFHFTKTMDKPSVNLFLGLDGTPTTTCTYGQDPSDASGQSWILSSCTGGFKAGDLVNANWLSLAIVGGAATDELRAQIALSPLGDSTGANLIPPMPTFWGDYDTCIPSPVAGTVVTQSTTCANQVGEANTIINNYFNQVSSANPSPNWIVPPVPEFAMRHGDGTPNNNLLGPPPTPSDPPFDDSGDLNPGGSFDAYWRLNGDLTPTAVTGTDENKTQFDATFSAHGVLFGQDIDVLDVKVTADTDSGQTTPSYVPASSTGTLGFYVFGNEIPSGGFTVNPSTGFSVDPSWSQEFDLPPIQIWIFSITLGASAEAELNAMGSAALSGLDLSVTPSISLNGDISGGIDLVIAQGDVEAKVNLIKLSTPVAAQVKWVLNTSPEICAATLNGSLNGNLDLSSGGGEVDLDATFGICPFCYTDSETLFNWAPLASANINLFSATIDTQLFGLPAALCTFPMTATITSPTSGATLLANVHNTLQGLGAPTDPALAYNAAYTWTYTPANSADTVSVDPATATTANPIVVFSPPSSGSSSTWTIGMSAVDTTTSAGGTKLMSSATATPVTISVTNLAPGAYIDDLVGLGFSGETTTTVPLGGSGIPSVTLTNPGTQTINGLVVGGTGTLNTTFTVAACTDNTSACTLPCDGTSATNCSPMTLTTTNAATATPSGTWSNFTSPDSYYLLTMSTTQDGSAYGSAQVIVKIFISL